MSACISALTLVSDRDVRLILFTIFCRFPLELEFGPSAEIDWLALTDALEETECVCMAFVTMSVTTLFFTFVFDLLFPKPNTIFIYYGGWYRCDLYVIYVYIYSPYINFNQYN